MHKTVSSSHPVVTSLGRVFQNPAAIEIHEVTQSQATVDTDEPSGGCDLYFAFRLLLINTAPGQPRQRSNRPALAASQNIVTRRFWLVYSLH